MSRRSATASAIPTPEDCETLRLRAGETEFFDVVDETGNITAQYQLDLVKIHKGETASASKAAASSKAGRELLAERARLPFRFDVDSGTLERRPGAAGDVAAPPPRSGSEGPQRRARPAAS